MNILMLCSGKDEPFFDDGFQYPKNLIEIFGKPLIQRVLESFQDIFTEENDITLLIKKEESDHYHTATVAHLVNSNCHVLNVPSETRGAVCTALLAVEKIDNEEPLMIINGDIILNCSLNNALTDFIYKKADGGVLVFDSVHPRWSYVKCNEEGKVIEASEKRPISRLATVGVYYYRVGSDFVAAAKESIRKDSKINGKFYICPVFNEMILKQKNVYTYHIDRTMYHSLATTEGVKNYQKYLDEVQK